MWRHGLSERVITTHRERYQRKVAQDCLRGISIVHELFGKHPRTSSAQEHLRSVIDMGSRDGAVNLLLHRRDPSL
ncbi:hypothetical protein AVEN_166297-1, partial [Araneus ventricosus]